jgi:hypothetical protein
MSDKPGEHPAPHPQLARRKPLIHTLKTGTTIFRIHPAAFGAVFFGKTGNYRYDAPDCPDGSFGVMYAGEDLDCCFIESFGQTTGAPAVTVAYLEERHFAEMQLQSDLHLVDLFESGSLSRIGADGRLLTGSYKISQQWSAALRSHPTKPDGIRYRSRRDPAKVAYAIYERPSSTFAVTEHGSLMDMKNRAQLNRLLDLYQVDLLDA